MRWVEVKWQDGNELRTEKLDLQRDGDKHFFDHLVDSGKMQCYRAKSVIKNSYWFENSIWK